MLPLDAKQCTKCNMGTEYYISVKSPDKQSELVLYSDCCIGFIWSEIQKDDSIRDRLDEYATTPE